MSVSKNELEQLKCVELNILIEFDKVCRKLGINYTLSSGTLLGSVRHKGFIPWDDDIDVAMSREDYNVLLSQGKSFLPKNLFIQTYDSDRRYPLNFGKIRDTSTTLKEYSTRNIEMKTGVYIDIFPVDRISSNRLVRGLDNFIISLILAIKYSYTIEWALKSKSKLRRIIRLILYPLARLLGPQRLNRMETFIRIKNNKAGNVYTYGDRYTTPPNKITEDMIMNIDIFNSYEDVEFENKKFKAIKEKEEYLSTIYGDYMKLPAKEDRVFRHEYINLGFDSKKKE